MSGLRHRTPLTAWIIALALALPMLLPLFAPVSFVQPERLTGANEYHYRHDLSEFLVVGRESRTEPVGVMLAMSAGNCATAGPTQLQPLGAHMYVAFYPDARAESFDSLLEPLLAGRPDFVVVQDSVLVLDRPPKRYERFVEHYESARSYWSGQLFGVLSAVGLPVVDFTSSDEGWRCPAIAARQMNWEDAVQATMHRVDSYSQQRRSKSIELLAALSKADIPILIVSPPSNSYTLGYGMAVHQAAGDLVADSLPDSAVSLHRQATLTPTERFNDPMHLSPDASHPFRDWLDREIKDVVGERLGE